MKNRIKTSNKINKSLPSVQKMDDLNKLMFDFQTNGLSELYEKLKETVSISQIILDNKENESKKTLKEFIA